MSSGTFKKCHRHVSIISRHAERVKFTPISLMRLRPREHHVLSSPKNLQDMVPSKTFSLQCDMKNCVSRRIPSRPIQDQSKWSFSRYHRRSHRRLTVGEMITKWLSIYNKNMDFFKTPRVNAALKGRHPFWQLLWNTKGKSNVDHLLSRGWCACLHYNFLKKMFPSQIILVKHSFYHFIVMFILFSFVYIYCSV